MRCDFCAQAQEPHRMVYLRGISLQIDEIIVMDKCRFPCAGISACLLWYFWGLHPGGWSVIRPDRILIEFLLKFYRISVRFCGLGRGKFAGVRFNC